MSERSHVYLIHTSSRSIQTKSVKFEMTLIVLQDFGHVLPFSTFFTTLLSSRMCFGIWMTTLKYSGLEQKSVACKVPGSLPSKVSGTSVYCIVMAIATALSVSSVSKQFKVRSNWQTLALSGKCVQQNVQAKFVRCNLVQCKMHQKQLQDVHDVLYIRQFMQTGLNSIAHRPKPSVNRVLMSSKGARSSRNFSQGGDPRPDERTVPSSCIWTNTCSPFTPACFFCSSSHSIHSAVLYASSCHFLSSFETCFAC